MSSPEPSKVSPTQRKVLPFALATDPTLHRPAWRSTRAIEPSPWSPRRVGELWLEREGCGFGLTASCLSFLAAAAVSTASPEVPAIEASTAENDSPAVAQEDGTAVENAAPETPSSGDDMLAKGGSITSPRSDLTNLDELRWFQHRWLDKHGRNSNLKAARQQLALMRRWFDSLDTDGSGEVGLDELEDPLVSVGLAGSREDVQHLIEEVDLNGTGGVTFDAFLNLLYPERAQRERNRRFPPPLHTPKHRSPVRPDLSSNKLIRAGVSPKARKTGKHPACSSVVNPVARLFEDLQAGKLGDLAIPFPVLITAYRRRMLLNAHMADNPTTKRYACSVENCVIAC
ncbi:unnamed protein product [Phytophthora fragariaefolia]|uniref:Unnamed protein product n=1 Tax=Phytophthora fragariaefolia TaxID=1490495 RepID=A0A9W6WY26_9STRA|nr:unnamed protein product [Phytophthora fragariaefolia]